MSNVISTKLSYLDLFSHGVKYIELPWSLPTLVVMVGMSSTKLVTGWNLFSTIPGGTLVSTFFYIYPGGNYLFISSIELPCSLHILVAIMGMSLTSNRLEPVLYPPWWIPWESTFFYIYPGGNYLFISSIELPCSIYILVVMVGMSPRNLLIDWNSMIHCQWKSGFIIHHMVTPHPPEKLTGQRTRDRYRKCPRSWVL